MRRVEHHRGIAVAEIPKQSSSIGSYISEGDLIAVDGEIKIRRGGGQYADVAFLAQSATAKRPAYSKYDIILTRIRIYDHWIWLVARSWLATWKGPVLAIKNASVVILKSDKVWGAAIVTFLKKTG